MACYDCWVCGWVLGVLYIDIPERVDWIERKQKKKREKIDTPFLFFLAASKSLEHVFVSLLKGESIRCGKILNGKREVRSRL